MNNRNYLVVILITTIILSSQSVFGISAQVSGPVIPQWIKNNAKWWADSQVEDSDFIKGIQYLIQNGIIQIPQTQSISNSGSQQIPQWVKNTAGWWADGTIDDSEFVKGIEYLVQSGIIQVSTVQQRSQSVNASSQSVQASSDAIPTSCNPIDNGVLPDPICTPGATDPRVTQNNIDSTICVVGYTKTVRPPVSYTEPLKFKLMDAYEYTDSASNYELDHLIPLEIGGAPSDVRNLWPEPHYTTPDSYDKDTLENYLHKQVCSGVMDLKTAQSEIATNWVKYWSEIPSTDSSASNFDNQNDPDGDQPIIQANQNTSLGMLHVDLQGSNTITRGSTQSMAVIVTDGINPVSDVNVSVHVTYASGYTTKNFDGITDSNGQYDFAWKIGGNSDPGTFQVDVDVSKTGYSSANDSFSFEVTEK